MFPELALAGLEQVENRVNQSIEVRGGLYAKALLYSFELVRMRAGKQPFANQEMLPLDLCDRRIKITTHRDLETFIYTLNEGPLDVHSQWEFLNWLRSCGFNVHARRC